MSMLASERFERCVVSVVPGCDTGRGRVILALLSDELYDSVTRINHKVSFPVWPKAFVGDEARCFWPLLASVEHVLSQSIEGDPTTPNRSSLSSVLCSSDPDDLTHP